MPPASTTAIPFTIPPSPTSTDRRLGVTNGMRTPGDALGVALVGCGKVATQYVHNLGRYDSLRVVACADADLDRATTFAAEHGIPRGYSADEALAAADVDIVVNLTPPQAHAPVSRAALDAGKHVYSEKPLATNLHDARAIVAAAESAQLMLGCAPDTFLGGGLQTCRALIDDGAIGEVVGADAAYRVSGHEHWHPEPMFFYQPGGGPALDLGPYLVTALVTMLGAVRGVASFARAARSERVVSSEPRRGERIPVHVATHSTAVLEFASGPLATLTVTWDVAVPESVLVVHGTDGTMRCPDPDGFGGPISIRRAGSDSWADVPLRFPADVGRGIGIADMAAALESGTATRVSAGLALHVLEVLLAVADGTSTGVPISSPINRPPPIAATPGDGHRDG
jgi:predicted dehydrogenase